MSNNYKNKKQYFQDFSKKNTKKLLADASLIFSIHETSKVYQSESSIDTKFNNLKKKEIFNLQKCSKYKVI